MVKWRVDCRYLGGRMAEDCWWLLYRELVSEWWLEHSQELYRHCRYGGEKRWPVEWVRELPRWQLPDPTQLVTCPDTLLDWAPLLSPRLVPSEQISHIREAVAAISGGVKTQSNNWVSYKVWNREQSCLLSMSAWRCENSGVMSLVGHHGGKTVKTVECVWAVVDDTCYKCKKLYFWKNFTNMDCSN